MAQYCLQMPPLGDENHLSALLALQSAKNDAQDAVFKRLKTAEDQVVKLAAEVHDQRRRYEDLYACVQHMFNSLTGMDARVRAVEAKRTFNPLVLKAPPPEPQSPDTCAPGAQHAFANAAGNAQYAQQAHTLVVLPQQHAPCDQKRVKKVSMNTTVGIGEEDDSHSSDIKGHAQNVLSPEPTPLLRAVRAPPSPPANALTNGAPQHCAQAARASSATASPVQPAHEDAKAAPPNKKRKKRDSIGTEDDNSGDGSGEGDEGAADASAAHGKKKVPAKNVPLFIGTRLKNCLRAPGPIQREAKRLVLEGGYAFDDFLDWINDPLVKLKEIWHFQIMFTVYENETPREKFFKTVFKRAAVIFLQNYAVNSIIWSGQSLHSLTLSNACIKKPAVLKKIGKFMIGINNAEQLKGMFREKKAQE